MFRCSVVLKDKIDPERLQKAVDLTLPRFPTLSTILKRGFFWHYLEVVDKQLKVEKETKFPCHPIRAYNRNFLFRVVYSDYRLSVDMCHILSDGGGAYNFLISTLATYLELGGENIADTSTILYYKDAPNESEEEDSYQRYYQPEGERKSRNGPKVYQLEGTQEPPFITNVINGQVDANQLKDIAKKHGCTIHSFINALLAYSIYEYALFCGKHPDLIGLENTIDLRKYFPSQTLRNFSCIRNMFFSGKENYSFEDFIKMANDFQNELKDTADMQRFININVASQKTPFVKFLPLFIKNIGLKVAYNMFGSKHFSMEFSNLGVCNTPKEFEKHVERFEAHFARQRKTPICTTIVSWNGKTVITFSSGIQETYLQRMFFKKLSQLGVDVLIDSNMEGNNV